MKEDPVILEYGMPNMCKPINFYHLRSFIIGDALGRVIRASGAQVICDLHSSDVGYHVACLIYYINYINQNSKFKNIEDIYKSYFIVNELSKENLYVRDKIKEIIIDMQINPFLYKEMDKLYDIYESYIRDFMRDINVSVTVYGKESDYISEFKHLIPKMSEVGILSINGQEIIVSSTKDKTIPPLMIRHADGYYLYAGINLATVSRRISLYKPKKILYVITESLDLHMRQMFDASRQIGFQTELLHVRLGGFLIKHPFKIKDPFVLLNAISECKINDNFENSHIKKRFLYEAFKLENYIRDPQKKVFVCPEAFHKTKGYKIMKDLQTFTKKYGEYINEDYMSEEILNSIRLSAENYSLVPIMDLVRDRTRKLYFNIDVCESINIVCKIMNILGITHYKN